MKTNNDDKLFKLTATNEVVDFCLDAWLQMIEINYEGRTEDLDHIKDAEQIRQENVSYKLQQGFHGVVKDAFKNNLISIYDYLKKEGFYEERKV